MVIKDPVVNSLLRNKSSIICHWYFCAAFIGEVMSKSCNYGAYSSNILISFPLTKMDHNALQCLNVSQVKNQKPQDQNSKYFQNWFFKWWWSSLDAVINRLTNRKCNNTQMFDNLFPLLHKNTWTNLYINISLCLCVCLT